MEQTLPAKLEQYVNEMILASMILYVTKNIYFQFILRSFFFQLSTDNINPVSAWVLKSNITLNLYLYYSPDFGLSCHICSWLILCR